MFVGFMLGDCLEKLRHIPDNVIDMVLCDPPYGTTACKWDSIIPLEAMWSELKRIIKPNGAIVMTASQPFTTTLIASNMKGFKYCWVWDKVKPSGHLNAKKRPMTLVEDVCVFNVHHDNYNPQTVPQKPRTSKNFIDSDVYGKQVQVSKKLTEKQPKQIITISNANQKGKLHPTQKPVELMEYLIKTYTNEGETVLDFAMGSGTTAIACFNLNRSFIGVELDDKYFEIAKNRIITHRQIRTKK